MPAHWKDVKLGKFILVLKYQKHVRTGMVTSYESSERPWIDKKAKIPKAKAAQ